MRPKAKCRQKIQWEEVTKRNQQKSATNNQLVMAALKQLMQDERYPKDKVYANHVQNQFAKAYPGEVEYDETGKMIEAEAVVRPDEVTGFNEKLPNGKVNTLPQENHTQDHGEEGNSEFCKGLQKTIDEEKDFVRTYGQEYIDADYKVREMEGKLEEFYGEVENALSDYLVSVSLDIKEIAFGGLKGVISAAIKAGWGAAGLLEKHTRLNLMLNRDLPRAISNRDEKKYLLDKAQSSLDGYLKDQREKCN